MKHLLIAFMLSCSFSMLSQNVGLKEIDKISNVLTGKEITLSTNYGELQCNIYKEYIYSKKEKKKLVQRVQIENKGGVSSQNCDVKSVIDLAVEMMEKKENTHQ